MAATAETTLPPREWLEELKRNIPDPDLDNTLYLSQHQAKHLGSHDHAAAVNKISSDVKAFYGSSTPFRIYHGSTNSTRPVKFCASHMVDTSNLRHVLSVDRQGMTCFVEPNVPMDRLVNHLQPYGLVPPVVMEFPGITVGGRSFFNHRVLHHSPRLLLVATAYLLQSRGLIRTWHSSYSVV